MGARQAILALKEVDSDKDGEIDWEEFQELFDIMTVCIQYHHHH